MSKGFERNFSMKRIVASYDPRRLYFYQEQKLNFFQFYTLSSKATKISLDVIDPKSLSDSDTLKIS